MIVETTATVISESDLAAELAESRFVWPPLTLAVIFLWIAPLGTSLGLDETQNWWVVKDGLQGVLAHLTDGLPLPGGQSFLYNLLLAGVQAIGGKSDVALRLPSVIAMLVALYLLYRLGARLIGPLAAMYGCLVFACMRGIVYQASTVRPYAMGMSLVAGAMLALVNWFDAGAPRYLAVYALLSALSVYAHPMFALMFLVHALYALLRLRAGSSGVRLRSALLAWGASAALMLPLAPPTLRLFLDRRQHVYLPADVSMFLSSFAPQVLAGAIVLGVLLKMGVARVGTAGKLSASTRWFLAGWTVVPPSVLYLISSLTDTKVFLERYYLSSCFSLALLAGAVMRMIEPNSITRTIGTSIVVFSVLQFGLIENFSRGTEDWRGAIRAVNEHVGRARTPVLVVPGFEEARTLGSIMDERRAEVLFAPTLRYPVGGRLIRMPLNMTAATEPYLSNVIVPSIGNEREFMLVGLGSMEGFEYWLSGRCLALGFAHRTFGYYGGLKVVLFERTETK